MSIIFEHEDNALKRKQLRLLVIWFKLILNFFITFISLKITILSWSMGWWICMTSIWAYQNGLGLAETRWWRSAYYTIYIFSIPQDGYTHVGFGVNQKLLSLNERNVDLNYTILPLLPLFTNDHTHNTNWSFHIAKTPLEALDRPRVAQLRSCRIGGSA